MPSNWWPGARLSLTILLAEENYLHPTILTLDDRVINLNWCKPDLFHQPGVARGRLLHSQVVFYGMVPNHLC